MGLLADMAHLHSFKGTGFCHVCVVTGKANGRATVGTKCSYGHATVGGDFA
tara:strand:+ start:242 stop:394 length:153 start_codon:yes stop_codon:yes gene_type:complete